MNNLIQRTIFGGLYVVLLLWAVLTPTESIFRIIFSTLTFAAMWEYQSLIRLHQTRPLRTVLDALAAIYLIWVVPEGNLIAKLIPFALYVSYLIIRSLYSNRADQPVELSKILFGHIYITLPMIVASCMHQNSVYGGNILLLILVCIWSNDTGAYITGSLLGKHKLFPQLSPKKSWEGFIGGIAFSVLAAFLINNYTGLGVYSSSSWMAILLGILISIFATWGDLFESMLKRNAGVKDSGHLIPGHGGILDRIDSMLFVLPLIGLTLHVAIHLLSTLA